MKELILDVCHLPSAAAEQHAKTEFVMLCVKVINLIKNSIFSSEGVESKVTFSSVRV